MEIIVFRREDNRFVAHVGDRIIYLVPRFSDEGAFWSLFIRKTSNNVLVFHKDFKLKTDAVKILGKMYPSCLCVFLFTGEVFSTYRGVKLIGSRQWEYSFAY